MNIFALPLAFQGHAVFDVSPASSFGGLAAGATAFVFLGFLANALIGVAIYFVAADLKDKGEGPVALPPSLWGLLCFMPSGMGQVAAIGLFIFVHFGNWLDQERAWRPRGIPASRSALHQEKVRELQEELDALRAQNRADRSS